MKKVIFIMNTLNGGGAEKILVNILDKLNKKYQVTLFLLHNEGIYLEEIKKIKNLKYEFLFDKYQFSNLKILYKFQVLVYKLRKALFCLFPDRILRVKKIDTETAVVIGFLEGPVTLFLANLKKYKRKIAWIHTDLEKHKTLNRKLEKISYLKIDKIVCVSNDSKNSVEKLYPELGKRIEVIYNPISKNEIQDKSLLKKNIFSNNKINIVIVGRLNRIKGIDILLEAHNLLLKEKLDYNLYILGEGDERKKIEQYIKDNNIEKNTFLLGFKRNPYPYIKEADIFISSSRYEGYPLVICEAICLEKPIIATKCTGPNEILEDGKYGLLAEVENVESLKENMKKLILSEELRKKYSKLSKERSEIFDINKTMKQIERVLDE